jgi:tRNA G18 (ribose-2'-O)-methylase SpoU
MAELAILRTAKAAVVEGLITDEDYNTIKLAFLKVVTGALRHVPLARRNQRPSNAAYLPFLSCRRSR